MSGVFLRADTSVLIFVPPTIACVCVCIHRNIINTCHVCLDIRPSDHRLCLCVYTQKYYKYACVCVCAYVSVCVCDRRDGVGRRYSVQQRCNRGATEVQQRCNRGATEVQQRCNRGATGARPPRGSTLLLLYSFYYTTTLLLHFTTWIERSWKRQRSSASSWIYFTTALLFSLYSYFTTPLYYLDREVMEATEELGLLVDLRRQFARRRQHQHLYTVGGIRHKALRHTLGLLVDLRRQFARRRQHQHLYTVGGIRQKA
jgi:hypothetical protein